MAPLNPDAALVLVTGATGFVGTALCTALPQYGFRVRRAVRASIHPGTDAVVVGHIDATTDWSAALAGVDGIVHLAARTHDVLDPTPQRLDDYRRLNVAGTRRLAEEAARAGVRRFVFMSSVKVNGEATQGRPFRESDVPQPRDAYGITKLEAEQVLQELSRAGAMEIVVLRPPLVYGAGVKGNFLRLMGLLARGVPLPFASIRNRRSLIYVGNLIDAIVTALRSPQAAGGTYLVSDGEALSTPDLLRRLGRALGRDARLLPCPPALLRAGRSRAAPRSGALTGSLEVDRCIDAMMAAPHCREVS